MAEKKIVAKNEKRIYAKQSQINLSEKKESMIYLEMPEDEDEKMKKKSTLSGKSYSFADSITMHGIRYIFGRDICKFRRLFTLYPFV